MSELQPAATATWRSWLSAAEGRGGQFDGWRTMTLAEVGEAIRAEASQDRALILVDGASGSGKSTFARHLAGHLPGASVVATDDIAWHLPPTEWAGAMIEGVIGPWQDSLDVAYRPPGWVDNGRPGQVTAPASQFLIVEGVGAGREVKASIPRCALRGPMP